MGVTGRCKGLFGVHVSKVAAGDLQGSVVVGSSW